MLLCCFIHVCISPFHTSVNHLNLGTAVSS